MPLFPALWSPSVVSGNPRVAWPSYSLIGRNASLHFRDMSGNGSSNSSEDGEEVGADQFKEELVPGNFIWVKVGRNAWWPAQVVDENSISDRSKPGNKSMGEVLVRIYGSYQYLYVDPIKCHSEFVMILKQNNGSCRDILNKSLEQDLPLLESGRSKFKPSKSTGNVRTSASKKTSSRNLFETNQEQDGESSCAADFEPSARRKRVMQSLGLMAPSGSPFGS